VLRYKLISSIVAGVVAALAGVMYVISYRYVGSASVFGIDKTIDALLMTIIGGVGTLFGPIIGSGIVIFAHDLLSDLASIHPIFERWLILFGILYVLIVMFFPKGIMGTFQKRKNSKSSKKTGSVPF
jgi:branched-chain amino acid transport system permease protein